MPKIVFDNVTKLFHTDVIGVENLSFKIEKGEFVFVIGNSGAGKSTLLKLMTAQIPATSGDILIEHDSICRMKSREIPYLRRKFGIMQNEMGLLNDRSVFDNVALAMMATEQPKNLIRGRVDEVLGVVGMRKNMQKFPNELSGGEISRALLARALVINPHILVADEPTANLDPDASWDLMCMLDDIHRQGLTVIVASHAKELVNIMKKRVLTLADGRIIIDEKKAKYSTRILAAHGNRKNKEQ